MKKILKSIVFTGAFLALAFYASRLHAQNTNHSVTADDLVKVGFTNVRQETPTAGGRFVGPNEYFEVSDKVASPDSEAPNIVMVSDFSSSQNLAGSTLFTYGSDSHDFAIPGGRGKEGAMFDGRTAINFVKNNHYIVIVGPNREKIEALALAVANKIQ